MSAGVVWPATVRLRVEPVELRAAVDAIGRTETAGGVIPPDRLAALGLKLREAPDVGALRLTNRELRYLGVLIGDSPRGGGDPGLRRALRDATIANSDRLPASTVAQALAMVWPEPLFEAAILRRAEACPGLPAWVAAAVGARGGGNLPQRLCRALNLRDTSIGDLSTTWQVPRGSPLHLDTSAALLMSWTPAQRAARWERHVAFVRDSDEPMELRQAVMTFRFNDLDGPTFNKDLRAGTPMALWLELARDLCKGWPTDRPTEWARLPSAAAKLAQQYIILLAIDGFFDRVTGNEDRKRYWRRRVKQIVSFVEFRKANAFAMQLGPRYVVEFLDVGNACYSYDEAQFQQIRRYNPSHPAGLKLSGMRGTPHWLSHHSGWEGQFDRYLREHCFVPLP